MFVLHKGTCFTPFLVYVDDVILAVNSLEEIVRIKFALDDEFKIKDLGKLKYFLGIEVAHSNVGISICQRKYYLDLLNDTRPLGCKPAKTPLDPCVKLHQDSSTPYEYILGYMRLVGKLLYLTTTRPNTSFATHQLSQILSSTTVTHDDTTCRVVKYLKGSSGRGLLFIRYSNPQIIGLIYVNWPGCIESFPIF